ncbi:murein L,D-transpeptidase family protein [Thiobacillus sp.]|uniref:L,D-transpeptidase family protein n=1 Tax=Thiobacillus sp. TaxID=924 RepID=UPI0025D875AE|nr:L,D-transpeptidase [Thiobacillus sp.]MBT9540070.1 L,D-transpeptidase [Thiobacillus sp.]
MRYLLLTLLLAAPVLQAAELDADRQLTNSLLAISQSRVPEALDTLDSLTQRHPNFRLAQLIKGDMLLARAQPLQALGNPNGASSPDLELLRDEARQRMRAVTDLQPNNKIPAYLLNLEDDYRHALVVDASRSRLYVYENRAGLPLRVADFYVTIGKAGAGKQKEGDNRTPVGIYSISGFKSSKELGDFYGSGAFTLSYPNEWDKRQGRSGHGIWIHGSPSNTYSRAPRASEGCVVLANDDLTRLGGYIKPGKTPVIIAEQVEWVSQDALDARRNDLAAAIDQWRVDWESRDTARLLTHYSATFHNGEQNLSNFAANKHKVNADKAWIKIGLDKVSLLLYPERSDFALVSFVQNYRSNSLNDRTTKRQFWSRENGRWKIIHETSL